MNNVTNPEAFNSLKGSYFNILASFALLGF